MTRWTLTQPHDVRNAWLLWLAAAAIIVSIAAFSPQPRTVTPAYRNASLHWLSTQDIYNLSDNSIHGYLYLPHAAILYIPFAILPLTASEILWRLFCISLLALAIWRFSRLTKSTAAGGVESFPLITLLVIPPALDSARNGQMNLPLIATMILATVELARARYWPALLWLCLGVALKPLMLVLILLAAAVYRPILWRIPLAVAATLLFPFFTHHTPYVWRQYNLFLEKMTLASQPPPNAQFSDLFGLLQSLHIQLPHATQALARIAAAILILLLCLLASKKYQPIRAAVFLLSLASAYLMLFNPRTENNSYVLLAPAIAFFTAQLFLVQRKPLTAWLFVTIIVGITFSYELTRGTNLWLNPTLCLVFLAYLLYLLLMDRSPIIPPSATRSSSSTSSSPSTPASQA